MPKLTALEKKRDKELDLDNPLLEISSLLGNDEVYLDALCDPYDFIFHYSYTLDPHDPVNPVKKIPETPYVKALVDMWLENSNLLVVKSRQMMVTWLFVALNLWLAMTRDGQYIFFVSKKEDDANYSSPLSLLSRAHFIYLHLPKEMRVRMIKKESPAMMHFKGRNSIIHGVSQDSEALRQYTTSSLFFDEMAFQENADKSFAAIKPTLDGKKTTVHIGERLLCLPKFAGVSTPNGKRNLFYKLVNDNQE